MARRWRFMAPKPRGNAFAFLGITTFTATGAIRLVLPRCSSLAMRGHRSRRCQDRRNNPSRSDVDVRIRTRDGCAARDEVICSYHLFREAPACFDDVLVFLWAPPDTDFDVATASFAGAAFAATFRAGAAVAATFCAGAAMAAAFLAGAAIVAACWPRAGAAPAFRVDALAATENAWESLVAKPASCHGRKFGRSIRAPSLAMTDSSSVIPRDFKKRRSVEA